MKARLLGLALLLSFAFASPALAQEMPNKQAVVQAVMDAHPEIDRCDEDSLDKGRAAIIDWAAQRLNKAEGRVVWGRKSRGRVVNGKADRPNTDALTFLRSDGRFELVDAVSGSAPCNATWGDHGVFAQGANGFWAPPQLGPEPGTDNGGGGGGGTDPDLGARVTELEATVATLRANVLALASLQAKYADLEKRVVALETPMPPPPPPPGQLEAIAREQLETSKAILELLRKTAERFGVR